MIVVVIMLITMMMMTVLLVQQLCSHWMPVKRLIMSLMALVIAPILLMITTVWPHA